MTAGRGTALPRHGRVDCSLCHRGPVTFDVTRREHDGWRITANPLSWGNERPKVLVLGFSKGPTQAGALANHHHDEIAYKDGRQNAYRILERVGLVPPNDRPEEAMGRLIADRNGAFGFGSLVRCTVERWGPYKGKKQSLKGTMQWQGSGGMLDRFAASTLGEEVVARCATRFLADLPTETRLVIMFGMGTGRGYVKECARIIGAVRRRPGWRVDDDVSYGDEEVTFVHVEHFASQGALVPNWLGAVGKDGALKDKDRAAIADMSAAAVRRALASAI